MVHMLSAASLCLLLLLTSCLYSDKPLLGSGDTPFPETFRWVGIDKNNNIRIDKNGLPLVIVLKRDGLNYTSEKDGKPFLKLTFHSYDTSNRTYAVQAQVDQKQDGFDYSLLKMDASNVILYGDNASIRKSIRDELKQPDPNNDLSEGITFKSMEELYTAFRVLLREVSRADVTQFRMASTTAELNLLESDIALAKSRWVSSQTPGPAISGSMGQWKLSQLNDPMTDNTVYAVSVKSQPIEDYWPNATLAMTCNVRQQQTNLVINWSTSVKNLLPGGAIPIALVVARFDKDPAQYLGWHIMDGGYVEAQNNGGKFLEGMARLQGNLLGDPEFQNIRMEFANDFFNNLGKSHSLLLRVVDFKGSSLTAAFNVEGSVAAAATLLRKCKA